MFRTIRNVSTIFGVLAFGKINLPSNRKISKKPFYEIKIVVSFITEQFFLIPKIHLNKLIAHLLPLHPPETQTPNCGLSSAQVGLVMFIFRLRVVEELFLYKISKISKILVKIFSRNPAKFGKMKLSIFKILESFYS